MEYGEWDMIQRWELLRAAKKYAVV